MAETHVAVVEAESNVTAAERRTDDYRVVETLLKKIGQRAVHSPTPDAAWTYEDRP